MKYAGKKLPLEFSNNPITNKIFHYVQQSSVNFSSILYKTNKTYLIIKNEKTPYF